MRPDRTAVLPADDCTSYAQKVADLKASARHVRRQLDAGGDPARIAFVLGMVIAARPDCRTAADELAVAIIMLARQLPEES